MLKLGKGLISLNDLDQGCMIFIYMNVCFTRNIILKRKRKKDVICKKKKEMKGNNNIAKLIAIGIKLILLYC